MSWVDGLIVLVFVLYALISGWSSKDQASKNLEEYFLAGRSVKGWQAGLSMAATQFASDTPLLVTGLIATAGVFSLWQMWIYALAFLLLGFVLAPLWRRANVITDAELTELRYGERPAFVLRIVKSIYFGTIFNCTVLAWVLFAAAKIAEPFLTWNLWVPQEVFSAIMYMVKGVGVPLNINPADPEIWVKSTSNFISIFAIVAVTFLYSTTGGLRAVIKTDIFQLFLMLGATALFAYYVLDAAGGMDQILGVLHERFPPGGEGISADQILAFTPDRAYNVSGPWIAVFLLQWLIQLNSDGTGYLAQRSMACRSAEEATKAAVVFSFTQVLLRSLLWLPIALGLLALYPWDPALPEATRVGFHESTFILGMRDLLPVGVKGLLLTGMLAALASTVDTHLNWGSSYWTNDIYKRAICQQWLKREPSNRSLVRVARVSNLIILLLALFISTQLNSIQDTWQISLLLGAGVGIVLILRWIWWKMTAWGEIAAILASFILAPLCYYHVESQALRLLLVALGSTLASLVCIHFMGPESPERLKKFYQQVRPVGFWGAVGLTEEENRACKNRLLKGLGAMSLCAISLFSLLVGMGSWWIQSPAPHFFPHAGLWQGGLVAVGLLCIPLWLRWGLQTEPNSSASLLSSSVVLPKKNTP